MRRWGWRELGMLAGLVVIVLLALVPGASPPASGCAASLAGAELDHLARCDHGATVRVSSVMRTRGHGLFLIDGETRDDGWRRWSSLAKDERPRIEIALPEARVVGEVVLYRPKRRASAAELEVALRVRRGDEDVWREVAVRARRFGSALHLELEPVAVRALEIAVAVGGGDPVELVEVAVLPGRGP